MNFVALFALIAILNVSVCFGGEIAGSDAKSSGKSAKLFKKFDMDKNGFIDNADIEAFFHQGALKLASSEVAQARVTAEIMSLDKDNNGNVSEPEFEAGVAQFLEPKLVQNNKEMCSKEQEARAKCTAELDAAKRADLQLGPKIKVGSAMCSSGVSGTFGYPTQKCAVAATSCKALVECYAPKSKALEISGTQNLVKRNGDVWRIVFWTSLIILGIFAIPSLIFIPFYVIVVIVAGKAIDFDRM